MAEAPELGTIAQIAPHDHPPFRDICDAYRQAALQIGYDARPVYLAPPVGEPDPFAVYLPQRGGRPDARALAAHVEGLLPPAELALCHRYRAYRTLRRSHVDVARVVTVAHEFGLLGRWQRRLERRLLARGVEFAGVSPAVQGELAAVTGDALCLPNALDLDRFDAALATREEALAAFGLEPGPFTIGLVGRLVPKKQPLLAVDALRRLISSQGADGGDVRLLVIGDGELADSLAQSARGLPVVLAGFVPDARRLLRALDVLLLVSRSVEAFGMTALEAMAAGVPVVSGPQPGPRYVLGSSGCYYDRATPEDIARALERVRVEAAGPDAQSRSRQARGRAEREFSVAALADRLRALLEPV